MNEMTWEEFDEAVESIAMTLEPYCKGRAIYGEPRGGLALAVALSHKLGIPYTPYPQAATLWVDDIYDSGTTYEKARKYMPHGTIYVVWLIREKMLEDDGPMYYRAIDDDWVVFPWEDKEKAEQERSDYENKSQ